MLVVLPELGIGLGLRAVPIYTFTSTFDKPTVAAKGLEDRPVLNVIKIDNLPSLLPREASDTFSQDCCHICSRSRIGESVRDGRHMLGIDEEQRC